jgi:hypothetical protein
VIIIRGLKDVFAIGQPAAAKLSSLAQGSVN